MIPLGFTYIPNFIAPIEEQNLLAFIQTLDWEEVNMYGVVAKRQVVHYGLNYTYESRKVIPTKPAPKILHPYINRVAASINVKPEEIVEILITHYPIGAGIGWHKDAAVFGDKILGISLENPCTIKLRKCHNDKYIIFKQILEPGSAYILANEARKTWQHTIAPLKQSRYSITFRMLPTKQA